VAEAESEFKSLMTKIRQGSSEAIGTLIEQHADTIYRIVRKRLHRLMRSQFDTEDFVQIVWASFFSAMDDLSTFKNPQELEAFLSRIAENKVIDACRRRMILQKNNVNRERSLNGNTPSSIIELQSDDPSVSHVAAVREQWDRLLQSLPGQYRKIVVLRAGGATFQEIADEIGINERTVRRFLKNLSLRTTL
jgi:RNA polymerase sigma factor (sigma-70 family)